MLLSDGVSKADALLFRSGFVKYIPGAFKSRVEAHVQLHDDDSLLNSNGESLCARDRFLLTRRVTFVPSTAVPLGGNLTTGSFYIVIAVGSGGDVSDWCLCVFPAAC